METVETDPPIICPSGREVNVLNPASDDPTCVGCGYPPERCTCRPND